MLPSTPMTWILIPHVNRPDLTRQAVLDALHQTIPTRVLLVANGATTAAQEAGYLLAADHPDRVLLWHYTPSLPLAAVWNRMLQCAWDAGGTEALVVNNDVRLPQQLVEALLEAQRQTDALVVTPVNVGVDTYPRILPILPLEPSTLASRGGPDFSCFLITKACHEAAPFDEKFDPAFCEDLDYHRRLLLSGYGPRIFSLPIPYLHYGSQTLQAMPEEKRGQAETAITSKSRAHYRAKWGGDVNQETYTRPFDPTSATAGVTTPELQRLEQEGTPT